MAGGGSAAADACCSSSSHTANADPDNSAAALLLARASRLERELLEDEQEDDPTLQDCCRRDLEGQAKESRVQAALARVDRSTAAELARRLGGAVVPPRPPPRKDDDDDDDDEPLEKLRDLRLSQLKSRQEAAKKPEGNDEQGPLSRGRLSEIRVSKVFSLAASLQQSQKTRRKRRDVPLVVHLADAGSSAGAALDELLETLSGDFAGSRFARASPSKNGRTSTEVRSSVLLAASFSPEAAREGAGGVLAVFRGGGLVAAVPVSAFCSGDGREELIEESVVSWLRKGRALSEKQTDDEKVEKKTKKRGGDDDDDDASSSSSSDDESDGDGDEAEPCDVCGRTYYHTHVRPVRSGGGGGGGGGGGSDDSGGGESGSD